MSNRAQNLHGTGSLVLGGCAFACYVGQRSGSAVRRCTGGFPFALADLYVINRPYTLNLRQQRWAAGGSGRMASLKQEEGVQTTGNLSKDCGILGERTVLPAGAERMQW